WLASVHNGVPEGLHGTWMVLAVWATWRCVRRPSRMNMVLVAASWTMLALASWYLVIPGVAVAAALALAERPTPRALGGATLPGLIPVAALAATARAAFENAAVPLGKALQRDQTSTLSLQDLSPPSISLVELFTPLAAPARDGDHLTVAAYLGLIALLAGTLGLSRTLGRRSIPPALAALGLVVLGLGNSLALHPDGDPIAVLPLAPLRWLPGLWAMEHTWRVLPGVGLVLSLGAAALAAGWRPLWLGAFAVLVVADLRAFGPMRGPLALSDATAPPAVAALAGAPDGAVLSVPRDGQGEPYGYHQTVHGHPVPWAFDAPTNAAHGRFLDALAAASRSGAPLDQAASRIGQESGIRYLVVVPGPDLRRSRHHDTVRALEAALAPVAGTPPREIRSYRLW
ncbi:MAG: hypothetical protein VX000_00115, partial [Myxococcota bacterium]|nr:hypothetical protein [Myxococcota bacterium]